MTEDNMFEEDLEVDVPSEPVDVSSPADSSRTLEENPLITEFRDNVGAGMSADDLILWLRDSQEISFPAAVRLYAELNKMTSESGADSKSAQVTGFIKEKWEQGYNRGQIIQLMVDTFNYTAKSAASIFSTSGKTLGIISGGRSGGGGQKAPLADVVAMLRTKNSREEWVKGLMELGYSESTAGHFVNYIPMAKEWAKQEAA